MARKSAPKMPKDKRYIPKDADIFSRCRSIHKPGLYLLIPEANRVPSAIPNFKDTIIKVLMTPRLGARFTQYELDMQPTGCMESLVDDDFEHFIYVLRGGLAIDIGGEKKELEEGGFAFMPDDMPYRFENPCDGESRLLWTKQRFQPLENLRPEPIFSHEADVKYIVEDTYLEQHLIPYDDNMAYDMAFNRLWFEAGVTFGFVETHIMEHGLYLLEGRGIYYLNNEYVEMQADDYLYMYPFVPQSFAATGWTEGRYLLNKDVNRDYDDRY